VTSVCSSAWAPVGEKPSRVHPSQASSQCARRVAASSSGIAIKGTTQSEDLI
jgi:hypothetical protein